MFVYLCSGDIKEVSNATSVTLSLTEVLLYQGKKLLQSFPRAQVYFCSPTRVPPFFT